MKVSYDKEADAVYIEIAEGAIEIKEGITKEKIKRWTNELVGSFTKIDTQKKIDEKKETLFAMGFIEE